MTSRPPSLGMGPARPIGRTAMGAFVGFFLGPAVVVPTLCLSEETPVSYGNSGLVLLTSVGLGAAIGSAIGAAWDLRRGRRRSFGRLLAEGIGGAAGAILGALTMTSHPEIGGGAGLVFGLISAGLLASGGPAPPPGGPAEADGPGLWDGDLDPIDTAGLG